MEGQTKWAPGNGRGHGRYPLILKMLAGLRCLGKGVDPEDVADQAHISPSALKTFVPKFIQWLTYPYSLDWRQVD